MNRTEQLLDQSHRERMLRLLEQGYSRTAAQASVFNAAQYISITIDLVT